MTYFGKYAERYTLVDVDGAVLTAGAEVEISEPKNFGTTEVQMERQEEFKGFNSEFTNSQSVQLEMDKLVQDGETHSAFSLIEAIIAADG